MKHVLTLEDTQPCTWTNPGYLNISDTHGKTFKPYADYMNNLGSDESRRLWSVCLDGLKLFGLTEEHVTQVWWAFVCQCAMPKKGRIRVGR